MSMRRSTIFLAPGSGETRARRVDDAHWFDQATVQALSFAIRSGGSPGVIFLLATEGETLAGIGAEELRLQRLDASSMRTLLVARTHDVLAPGATERVLQVQPAS